MKDQARYLARRRASLRARAVLTDSGCLEVGGYADPLTGYVYAKFNGKTVYAHRLAWALENGEIPADMQINHHCDNKRCIRVSHLYLGTHQENMDDGKERNRFKRLSGEKNGQAKLTDGQVAEVRADGRSQRTIAADHGVSRSAVQLIKAGKRRRA